MIGIWRPKKHLQEITEPVTGCYLTTGSQLQNFVVQMRTYSGVVDLGSLLLHCI